MSRQVLKGDNSFSVDDVERSILKTIGIVRSLNKHVILDYVVTEEGRYFNIVFNITSCGWTFNTYCQYLVGDESDKAKQMVKLHEQVNPRRYNYKYMLHDGLMMHVLVEDDRGTHYLDDNNEPQPWHKRP